MSMRPDPCIDENARILERYPTLQYSKAKYCNNNNTSSTCSCCSICLLDYKESDLEYSGDNRIHSHISMVL
ncbi:hypothetical protein Lal_00021538 [Lupinus albus]|nr:hypothetical protein Lal_00021538 [Lupinus albus]